MVERMVNQNTGRGLLLAAVALLFLFQAPGYKIGSLSRPGPGLFSVIVAGILLVIGIAIVVRSHWRFGLPLSRRLPQDTVEIVQPVFYPHLPFQGLAAAGQRHLEQMMAAMTTMDTFLDRCLAAGSQRNQLFLEKFEESHAPQ